MFIQPFKKINGKYAENHKTWRSTSFADSWTPSIFHRLGRTVQISQMGWIHDGWTLINYSLNKMDSFLLVTGRQGFYSLLPLRFQSHPSLLQDKRWSRLRDRRLSDSSLELHLRKFNRHLRWFKRSSAPRNHEFLITILGPLFDPLFKLTWVFFTLISTRVLDRGVLNI